MRLIAMVAALWAPAACGPKSADVETVPATSLHDGPETSSAPTSTPTAAPEVALPELGPISRDAIGVPPESKPVGAPVAIRIKPVPVGTVRVRSWRDEQTYGITPEGPRQKTTRLIQLVETITKLDGPTLAELRVEVRQADQELELAGSPSQRTVLLQGTYTVRGKDGGAIDVEHDTGREVGSREVEELSYALAGEFDTPWLVPFLASLGLRHGETVELSDEQKRAMAQGDPIAAPIFVSLVELTDTEATFQMNFQATDVGMFASLRTQQTVRVRRADGQFLESLGLTARSEPNGEQALLANRTVVTYQP